jgi:hypothetical protein
LLYQTGQEKKIIKNMFIIWENNHKQADSGQEKEKKRDSGKKNYDLFPFF